MSPYYFLSPTHRAVKGILVAPGFHQATPVNAKTLKLVVIFLEILKSHS